jgi:hypothetical protein
MELGDLRNERDVDGELTAMALAIQAIIDTGCECEEEERHTCIAGRCERALKKEREQSLTLRAELNTARNACCRREAQIEELTRKAEIGCHPGCLEHEDLSTSHVPECVKEKLRTAKTDLEKVQRINVELEKEVRRWQLRAEKTEKMP